MPESWIAKTAVEMTPPNPQDPGLLAVTLAGVAVVSFLAWKTRHMEHRKLEWLLFAAGVLLALSEVYKQIFRLELIDETFNVWYFPFQLCSMPMYLCLLLPFLPGDRAGVMDRAGEESNAAGESADKSVGEKSRTKPAFHTKPKSHTKPKTRIKPARVSLKKAVCTFLMTYNLLGAVLALIVPDGLLHPYWNLTLHAYGWHFLILWIGLSVAFSGMGDTSGRAFAAATGLLVLFAVIATGINVALHPYGDADMFYLSPYHLSVQMVFHDIDAAIGILPGRVVYLGTLIFFAWRLHRLIGGFQLRE